jgi:hypothetical protein
MASKAKKQPDARLGRPCPHCGADAWRWMGDRWRCSPCQRAADKARFTPEEIRRRNLLRRYGLTPEQYDALLVAQQGRCDICAEPMTGSRDPHVDHCHTTERIRSLLCGHCNRLLGAAQDDPTRLVAALDYITRHHPERFDS